MAAVRDQATSAGVGGICRLWAKSEGNRPEPKWVKKTKTESRQIERSGVRISDHYARVLCVFHDAPVTKRCQSGRGKKNAAPVKERRECGQMAWL